MSACKNIGSTCLQPILYRMPSYGNQKYDSTTMLINENATLKRYIQSMHAKWQTATRTPESVDQELYLELISAKEKLQATEVKLNESVDSLKTSMSALAQAHNQLAVAKEELKSAKEMAALVRFRGTKKDKEIISLKEAAEQSELKYTALISATTEIHGDSITELVVLTEKLIDLEVTNTRLQGELQTTNLSQKKSINELQMEIKNQAPLVIIGTAVTIREFNQSQRKINGDTLLKGSDPHHEATKAGNDAAHHSNGLAHKQLFLTGKLSTLLHHQTFQFLYDCTPAEFGTQELDTYEDIIEVQNMRASIKSQGMLDQVQEMQKFHFERCAVAVYGIAREGLSTLAFSGDARVRENMVEMRMRMDLICKAQWTKRYSV